jgi:NadR type nicotinamide-nucleotide adenylyltransferase
MNHLDQVSRIAIVGPECTGKTQLSMALAAHYRTVWVPEYARHYIGRLERAYVKEDLLKIAKGQVFTEDELALEANSLLICDTNLVVIKIWSDFKYGKTDPEIIRMLTGRRYDLHLLTNIDVPWEHDPQREHPDKRELLYGIYKKELELLDIPYFEISGSENQRLKDAIAAIDDMRKK